MTEEPLQPIERPQGPGGDKGPTFQLNVRTIAGGCLLGVLLLLGLMLPPVALGQRVFGFGYQRITANNPAATEGDLMVSLAEPDGSLRVRLKTIAGDAFDDERAGARWAQAHEALPPMLTLVGDVYDVQTRGNPNSPILVDLAVTGGAPLARLDLYAWDAEQGAWLFLPNLGDPATNTLRARLDSLPGPVAAFRGAATAPILTVIQEPGQSIDADLGASVNVLMPAGLQPSPDGSMNGGPAGGAIGDFAILPLVRNYSDPLNLDTASTSAILADTDVQQAHLDALVSLVVDGGNDGVALDYRGLTSEQQAAYTAFVTSLGHLLHDEGKQLAVIVPPPAPGPDPEMWMTAGYDWNALGAAADMLVIRPGYSPGDYASAGTGAQALAWATSQVSRYKLHLLVSAASEDVTNGVNTPLTYREAVTRLGPLMDPAAPAEGETFAAGVQLTFNLGGDGVSNVGVDTATGLPRYDWASGGGTQTWILTADKLRERLALANANGVAGVVVQDFLAEGNAPGVQQAVVVYKVSAPVTVGDPFEVEWIVKDSAGTVVRVTSQPFGEPVALTFETEDDYTAIARVPHADSDRWRELGPIEWTVGAGPPVEVEEEPAPVVQQAPTAPVVAAPPPVASAAAGGFELGGQTHSLANPGLMHDAGMTWVKFQEKWTPGMSGYDVGGDVELAHSNGFKVLYSIPGPANPSSIDYAAYIQFVREVAEAGADGIEIWNEMNLSREWPPGDISGTSYVNNMLAPAYNAIKSVNPSTLVISGALAPTGAFNGCGNLGFVSGCDDWYYNQQMAAAGAASYMDCVGLHYNAGASSPLTSTGHPADDGGGHYTWYFNGMVNAYSVVGKPLCFTELGFVSDDGYASVAGTNFDWGKNTTVAQQAQWLAEAVSQARGFARLLIVWNVDIFTYDPSDPQGGYAILRPDGSCPACDALAGVAP